MAGPTGAKPRAFVSHAHADHFARHESVLCSDVTAALLRNRFRLAENRLDASRSTSRSSTTDSACACFPPATSRAPRCFTSPVISDNASLLYTGDFKTRRSRTAEAVNFLTADTLIMETTFGLPGYEFPNPMEIEGEILRFVNDCFADGETPVLLGYSLGKAQEALALLEENGIPAAAPSRRRRHDARLPRRRRARAAGAGRVRRPRASGPRRHRPAPCRCEPTSSKA